jgi:hypothetical protein
MAWRQETLLCIVHSQSNLNICKIILEDFGHQILTVSSAREGLEVFASSDRCSDSRLPNARNERGNGCGRNERDQTARPHSHALRLGVTAGKRASARGRICHKRRSGRVLAPGDSSTIESSQKAKAHKSRYSASGGLFPLWSEIVGQETQPPAVTLNMRVRFTSRMTLTLMCIFLDSASSSGAPK